MSLEEWFTERNDQQRSQAMPPSDDDKALSPSTEKLFKTLAAIAVVAIVAGLAFIVFIFLVKIGLWVWNL